jgi:hypothetical protein
MSEKFESKHIKSILKDIINQKQLSEGINNVKLKDTWRNVMGENIFSYTKKIEFSKGDLYINLKSAPLKQELTFKKKLIIKKINDELSDNVIKNIFF